MRPITRLTARQQEIYDLLEKRPRTAAQLIDLIWQLHPQDAPQLSVIKAHINQMNAKLCYRGQRITAERNGPYQIIMVMPHAHPKRKPARAADTRPVEGPQSTSDARLD